jgi:nucleotide-binding universal stress UspA family protein
LRVFRKIIVGYDDTDAARDALALARLLAETSGASLVIAGVVPQHSYLRGSDRAVREEAARFAGWVEEAAAETGAEPRTLASASPARGLHELAEEIEADLIVVGSSSIATFGEAVAGGVAERLLHGSPCAVAIAPKGLRDEEPRMRVIAVGYDGGLESQEALKVATELGQAAEATLRVFVAEDPSSWPGADHGFPAYKQAVGDQRAASLEDVARSLPSELRAAGQLLHKDASVALAEEAEKGVDLLCVGSRAYGPLRRVLLGSVAASLVRAAPCPVLVVPRGSRTITATTGAST